MRPGRLLIVSTNNKNHPEVIPFRCLFCATLDWVLSTGDLPEWNEQSEQKLPPVTTSHLKSCGLFPFLVKPIILRWLGHDDDGSVTPSTTDLVRSATHHSS